MSSVEEIKKPAIDLCIEKKQKKFYKYVMDSGVKCAVVKGLAKLYLEPQKPKDAKSFVAEHMSEEYGRFLIELEHLKKEIAEANEECAVYQELIDHYAANTQYSDREVIKALENGRKQLYKDRTCERSLLRENLTRDLLDEIIDIRTKHNATLLDCIQSGFAYHISKIGFYAADYECYDDFTLLIDPMIRGYHGLLENPAINLARALDWGPVGRIIDLDPEKKYILSTRIRAARNLKGYPFFSIMKLEDFLEIEQKIITLVKEFEDDLIGTYISMKDIDEKTQEEMVNRHVLFKKGDMFLTAARAYRYWCKGRGLFYTPNEDFLIWVNDEDHLRIMTLIEYGNLRSAYYRFIKGMNLLKANLNFVRHPKYGYVTTCPSNLGTGLRVSVHIRLPCLYQDIDKLNGLLNEYNLQLRGTAGEDTDTKEGVLSISNKISLGITEYDVMKGFQDGILKLIQAEEELALLAAME